MVPPSILTEEGKPGIGGSEGNGGAGGSPYKWSENVEEEGGEVQVGVTVTVGKSITPGRSIPVRNPEIGLYLDIFIYIPSIV